MPRNQFLLILILLTTLGFGVVKNDWVTPEHKEVSTQKADEVTEKLSTQPKQKTKTACDHKHFVVHYDRLFAFIYEQIYEKQVAVHIKSQRLLNIRNVATCQFPYCYRQRYAAIPDDPLAQIS